MGVGWLRTYIKLMPISALFLPIDFGLQLPRAGAISFWAAEARIAAAKRCLKP
jgi:hypothetical protein